MMKKIIPFMLALTVAICVQAQGSYSLYVGDRTLLPPPSPPAGCALNKTAWGCNSAYVKVTPSGTGAYIEILDYFTGTAYVQCDYYYYKYVYGRLVTGNSTTYYYVTCKSIKLSLDKTTATMNVGESLSLTPKMTPYISPQPTVNWSSSNSSVATVSASGTVHAVGGGTATITASAGGGTATCAITVKKIDIPAESVVLPENITISIDKGAQLSAQVKPANFNGTLSWSSSNPDVASVTSSGYVTAHQKGTATITAKAENGKKGTCKVTVPAMTKEEADAKNLITITNVWSGIRAFVTNLKNIYNL